MSEEKDYSELFTEHSVLLFHTTVRWLSKGNMFKRLYKLKSEVEIIFLHLGINYHQEFY